MKYPTDENYKPLKLPRVIKWAPSVFLAGALTYGIISGFRDGWKSVPVEGLETKVVQASDANKINTLERDTLINNNKLVSDKPNENYKTEKIKNAVNYKTNDFSKEDIEIINYTANRVGVEPALLMAVRKAENGRKGLEFGIIPTKAYEKDKGVTENGEFRPYKNEFEKQASWCAWTIKKNFQRYKQTNKKEDFISYLQKTYCPVGVENDPEGLNKNWEKNVRAYYNKYKE